MNWLGDHGASFMKVARAYTLTSDECQDLAQEILLQAWQSLPKFEGKASAATWFYRVALHTAMNWHRKDKPRRTRQQPLLEVQALAPEGMDGAQEAQQRETVEQLYNAIHQLPKTDAALVLLYLDDLSYREMAGGLGPRLKLTPGLKNRGLMGDWRGDGRPRRGGGCRRIDGRVGSE